MSAGASATEKNKGKATCFIEESQVRWCYADDLGLKLSYADFREAWDKEHNKGKGAKEQELEQHFSLESFHTNRVDNKEPALTFEDSCKLICIWFPGHKDAVQQMTLLRTLMRRPTITECRVFIHEQDHVLTKKMCEDFSFKQITPIAKNKKLIEAFVSENQRVEAQEPQQQQLQASIPQQNAQDSMMETESEEERDNDEERIMPVALCNSVQDVQNEIPRVKLIEPLELRVGDKLLSFGRVQVPGLGPRFLTYEIIMGGNQSTQKGAANFFRELSEEKKHEVSLIFFILGE